MNIQERISAFIQLGERLSALPQEELQAWSREAKVKNPWFSKGNIRNALDGLIFMLQASSLERFSSEYKIPDQQVPQKKVAVIMAGNIPLVGFLDIFCVLLSGHFALIKCSSTDEVLPKKLLGLLCEIAPDFKGQFSIVDKVTQPDAAIATGSDNTSRYFQYYFASIPHIIRKNRVSVAVLSGKESTEELSLLTRDILDYHGMGCRNVAKVYLPVGADPTIILQACDRHTGLLEHNKYMNNHDYTRSIYLLNGEPHFDNGFLLLRETEDLVSPTAVVYYEFYKDLPQVQEKLAAHSDKIQCIVSSEPKIAAAIPFGKAQCPGLSDYPDGVDVMKFLLAL